jgi:phosphoglycerate dehydrogenase-like enzyme
VLKNERIAGAAVDVFAVEPPAPDHPFFSLDNIIVTPHAIAWTDELFAEMGRMACGGLIQLSHGEVPPHIVNRAVIDRPGFRAKLARLRERHGG